MNGESRSRSIANGELEIISLLLRQGQRLDKMESLQSTLPFVEEVGPWMIASFELVTVDAGIDRVRSDSSDTMRTRFRHSIFIIIRPRRSHNPTILFDL